MFFVSKTIYIIFKMKKLMIMFALMCALCCANAQDIVSNNSGCWPTLKYLKDYVRDGNKYKEGIVGCIEPYRFDVIADVELVGNDSVKITVIAFDGADMEPMPFFSILTVDKCVWTNYVINSNAEIIVGDGYGKCSFVVERKDGQMFIITYVGYDPVLIRLNCCEECLKGKKSQSLHAETR